ncbi:MAG TPA: peptide ABC transporter substrate-binding protein [Gaiellaceae bacterium]|nr:peptide ABC transporter substrate-binding protein [Gaiellaceae bacterium]
MDTIRRILLVCALVAVSVLVAAACGGGGGGDGDADGDGGGQPAAEQVIRINLGSEPPSLDPVLATDNISSFVLQQIMDPLVRLDQDSQPVAALAESWDVEGTTLTFHLRDDGQWTNGDPVTAEDFVYSWKRLLDPKAAAEYAYQFYGIVGAEEYNTCERNCDRLADRIGVEAVDERTLRVELISEQPWIVSQMTHQSFYPVHRATVEEFGDRWTEPENIVTSGPFTVIEWQHDQSMVLEKWDEFRAADEVDLTRVEMRMISDGVTALQAFEAGEVDACLDDACIPPQEIDRLKETEEFIVVPSLSTYYYGLNLKNVPDVNQRLALSFALDRTEIVEQVTKAGEIPATSMAPEGMPGWDVYHQEFLPTTADLEQAQAYLDQAQNPKTDLTLVYNNAPGHKEIATAVQSQWSEIGMNVEIKQQEWAQFLEFIGPPPNRQVDVFRLGWLGDYVDAFNFLELWRCDSGNNSTHYCDPEYDDLVDQARATPEDEERYELYRQMEEMLFGENGAHPIVPIYWYTTTTLRKTNVEGWEPNILAQYDLSRVTITE